MIKRILVALLVLLIASSALAGCSQIKSGNRIVSGKDVQTFNYAYIRLGDKDIVQGYVTQWRDYDNSDVVQVLIDGRFYLTHYSCCVLIADPSMGSLSYSDPDLFGGKE